MVEVRGVFLETFLFGVFAVFAGEFRLGIPLLAGEPGSRSWERRLEVR